jgi:hypothetical protein
MNSKLEMLKRSSLFNFLNLNITRLIVEAFINRLEFVFIFRSVSILAVVFFYFVVVVSVFLRIKNQYKSHKKI